jgi:glycosyltransferase involved in cell wall biosynthesis/metallophosphoesterase superfamily enzyme
VNAPRPDQQNSFPFRIVGFSDTFGSEAGNGVGRFLHDLHAHACRDRLDLQLVVPGRDNAASGILAIKAPSFQVPGYGQLQVALPLEHQRKTIERGVKERLPQCIHVSTPGPFGMFGSLLARRYRIPLVGIYHTDFPSYAREIVLALTRRMHRDPAQFFWPLMERLIPFALPYYQTMEGKNPRIDEDLTALVKVVQRNVASFSDASHQDSSIARFAEVAATAALRKFYSRFTFVIARSPDHQRQIAETLAVPLERLRCLNPGTDVDRFRPEKANRGVWSEYGVPPNAFVALYVGRITAEKNIGFLGECWRNFQSRHQANAHLVVVGHGEEDALGQLSRLPNVHVIGSHHGERLSTIYASADLLLFPSVTETLGQVGLEAGASGLPVIVSDRGGPQTYVEDGVSGRVLPTDDPELWANEIEKFAINDRRLSRRLGQAARQHIVQNYTIDHSMADYWALHQEAIDFYQLSQRRERKRRTTTFLTPAMRERAPHRGLMVISDYHAGRYFGNKQERSRKAGAIECMLAMAMERNLDVVFAGDFGDHGSRISRLEADFASLRSIRRNLGFGGAPVFVRGNHDYGYTDAQLSDWTGGCRVHSSLVYHHADSGITITHGQILALAKTMDVIRTAGRGGDLSSQLREDLLDDDLKPSVIAYDVANLIESALTSQGLTGLGTVWESLYPTRALLAEHLLNFARNTNQADEAAWKMIAGLVGTHDNVDVAAKLGAAYGGWASIFGHTHEALAKRKRVSVASGPQVAQVVANSGNMNRKRATCAVGVFPEVTVYRYHSKKQSLEPMRTAALSKSDAEDYLKRGQPRQACA